MKEIMQTIIEHWLSIIVILAVLIGYMIIINRYFNKCQKLLIMIVFPMLLFLKICEELLQKELSFFDNRVFHFISHYRNDWLTSIMKTISFFGSGTILVGIALLSFVWFFRNKQQRIYGYMICCNLILCSFLNEAVKFLFHRQRPDAMLRLINIGGFSFPSGHAMIGLAFYGLIIYFIYHYLQTKLKYVLITVLSFLIILIGISRIYLGVHYASDVIAGFLAGFIWLVIFITFANKLFIAKKKDL